PCKQSEDRHCRRPHPADQRACCLIAEAEVLRQPQHHCFVCDRVGCVNEKLDQERKPQLALGSLEHGEFRHETTQTCGYFGRHGFSQRDSFFVCWPHAAKLFRHPERRRGPPWNYFTASQRDLRTLSPSMVLPPLSPPRQ